MNSHIICILTTFTRKLAFFKITIIRVSTIISSDYCCSVVKNSPWAVHLIHLKLSCPITFTSHRDDQQVLVYITINAVEICLAHAKRDYLGGTTVGVTICNACRHSST